MTTTTAANGITDATYYPSAPGARTWREARDMYVNTVERVSITVGGGTATLFFGLRLVAERPVTDFPHHADMVDWARACVTDPALTDAGEYYRPTADDVTRMTAEARTLRAAATRHAYNMRRAVTATAVNRNADKLADAEFRLADLRRRMALATTR